MEKIPSINKGRIHQFKSIYNNVYKNAFEVPSSIRSRSLLSSIKGIKEDEKP
jgi:hypothetical protein